MAIGNDAHGDRLAILFLRETHHDQPDLQRVLRSQRFHAQLFILRPENIQPCGFIVMQFHIFPSEIVIASVILAEYAKIVKAS